MRPAGTVIDAHLIEYRNGKQLQHTASRNGFRYIARDGVNHFVSMKRSSDKVRSVSSSVRGLKTAAQ